MITSLDQVTTYPLCWPPTKPRAAKRAGSPFKTTMAKAQREIEDEMRLWRARRYLVSMAPGYVKGPTDPGVAVWFEIATKVAAAQTLDLRVLACDQYQLPADNLHAIGLTLNALRSVDRWGAYSQQQATEGMRALPPPASDEPPMPPWWETLGVERGWPAEAIEAVARTRVREHHPDTGGSAEAFQRFTAALDAMRKEKSA